MSEGSARSFREAVAARNAGSSGRRRFGADLRARAVALATRARHAGRSWAWIGRELGVRETLLQKWCVGSGSSFVRVEIDRDADSVTGGGLRVRTPEGFAIEGLDVAGAVELLRRLR